MQNMKIIIFVLFILGFLDVLAANADHGQETNARKSDEYYMQMAIDLAKKNPKAPFGALIVDNATGNILAKGLNSGEINPTFHGEIVAINNCAKSHPHLDWSQVTLYTTAEPCPMCQSAIVWSKISRVVFATSIEYLASHGWDQIDIKSAQVNEKAPFYKGAITGGTLAGKTNPLFNRLKD